MRSNIFDIFAVFEFEDFIMRAICDGDAGDYLYYMNHPSVSEFLSDSNCPKTINDALRDLRYWSGLFANYSGFYWAIANKENTMIGTVGFNSLSIQHRKGEISYDLDHAYWGKGIMRNCIKRILEFAKNEIKLLRVQAYTPYNNIRSQKLLQKLNFVFEGRLKKYEILHGKSIDNLLYAITYDQEL